MSLNNVDREKLKVRAKKLKALADRGIEGEQENAKRMYDDFIKKHGLEDIDESSNIRFFKIKYADDMLILFNVILSVNPFSKPVYEKNNIRVELDKEDYTEVKCKYRHFVKLWRIEKELLTMSFFSKHNEHFAPDEHARKKWREHHAENPAMVKARVDADILQEKATKFKSSWEDFKNWLNATSEALALMNFDRMQKSVPIMFDAEYKSTR